MALSRKKIIEQFERYLNNWDTPVLAEDIAELQQADYKYLTFRARCLAYNRVIEHNGKEAFADYFIKVGIE